VIVPQLLLAAGAEVREVDRPQELAEAAAYTAYLLRVLTLTGTDLGHPYPTRWPGASRACACGGCCSGTSTGLGTVPSRPGSSSYQPR
jgi:hypothetical protein